MNVCFRPERRVTGTDAAADPDVSSPTGLSGVVAGDAGRESRTGRAPFEVACEVVRRLRDNYLVRPREAWRCGGKAQQERSETQGTHRSTSEGSVDPRYYRLSEFTGYTYFTTTVNMSRLSSVWLHP